MNTKSAREEAFLDTLVLCMGIDAYPGAYASHPHPFHLGPYEKHHTTEHSQRAHCIETMRVWCFREPAFHGVHYPLDSEDGGSRTR
jgi:hypothetical protein